MGEAKGQIFSGQSACLRDCLVLDSQVLVCHFLQMEGCATDKNFICANMPNLRHLYWSGRGALCSHTQSFRLIIHKILNSATSLQQLNLTEVS